MRGTWTAITLAAALLVPSTDSAAYVSKGEAYRASKLEVKRAQSYAIADWDFGESADIWWAMSASGASGCRRLSAVRVSCRGAVWAERPDQGDGIYQTSDDWGGCTLTVTVTPSFASLSYGSTRCMDSYV